MLVYQRVLGSLGSAKWPTFGFHMFLRNALENSHITNQTNLVIWFQQIPKVRFFVPEVE